MKPILIDELHIDFTTSQEFEVEVNNEKLKGWQIAKPLNYDSDYFSMKDRREMASAILKGKAIAVCFFEDLTSEEQTEYVKKKLEADTNKVDFEELKTNLKNEL